MQYGRFSMLRDSMGADLSRGAAGSPDRLPSSEVAPAAALQASTGHKPVMRDTHMQGHNMQLYSTGCLKTVLLLQAHCNC